MMLEAQSGQIFNAIIAMFRAFVSAIFQYITSDKMRRSLPGKKREVLAHEESYVYFKKLTEQQISSYVASGDGLDKAGAYGIQGRAAAFVKHIEGSYTGVMGLPLYETNVLLRQFGIVH